MYHFYLYTALYVIHIQILFIYLQFKGYRGLTFVL